MLTVSTCGPCAVWTVTVLTKSPKRPRIFTRIFRGPPAPGAMLHGKTLLASMTVQSHSASTPPMTASEVELFVTQNVNTAKLVIPGKTCFFSMASQTKGLESVEAMRTGGGSARAASVAARVAKQSRRRRKNFMKQLQNQPSFRGLRARDCGNGKDTFRCNR